LDLARDTRSPEAAEAQLERFITQRHERRVQTEGERAAEEIWRESVARFHERSEAEMRSRWIDFHQNMRRLHSNLAAEHEAKAEKLLGNGQEGDRA
jgi:phosphoenolpyruvate-protein kinase (PTS system EI component)